MKDEEDDDEEVDEEDEEEEEDDDEEEGTKGFSRLLARSMEASELCCWYWNWWGVLVLVLVQVLVDLFWYVGWSLSS